MLNKAAYKIKAASFDLFDFFSVHYSIKGGNMGVWRKFHEQAL